MSTIDKMLIKGIRSFGSENKHVITFFKPLTLIVGPNGAGKTTIIECLRLSLTGDLPPNSRLGHSFIHDPKVAGETETKAQVKLRFKTVAGKDVVCIKSYQLTQKASKMEFKAIESVLQTINPNTGEKVCLSYRCADMDREITALMGVSKAILDNVIFVHQDESNWPLQDPATLKKKFDDIFSATRYTKALDVIKKLRREQAQEIKTYRLKLENLQTLKDAAYKLRDNIALDSEKMEYLKNQMKEFEGGLEVVESKIIHVECTLKELGKLQEQISTITAKRSTLFELQQKQYADLTEENEDTDEELREWQSKFGERIAQLETKISKLQREYNDAETQGSSLSELLDTSTGEIGKLEAEAEAYLSLRVERDSGIKKLFSIHNLGPLPDSPFSNEAASTFMSHAKTRLMDLDKDLQDKKHSIEMDLKNIWESYVHANACCSEKEAQRQAKVAIKATILKRISEREVERDLAEKKLSSLNLSHMDEREKTLQIEFERKTIQLQERDFESKINEKQMEISNLERKIKGLYIEKDVIASNFEERVKLDLKKQDIENCKMKHRRLMNEHKDRIRSALKGRLPPDKDLKTEISHAFGYLKKEYDDLNSKSLEAEKELKLVQMQMQNGTTNISKLQKEMDAKKRFIGSKLQSSLMKMLSDVDSFPKMLLEAMEERDVQKSKYNIADGMRQMFDPFEKVARAHHICPCCERPFSLEQEDDFVKKQRVKSAKSAEHMKSLAVETANADSHFQQLDKLRIIYEEYIKLGKETIPSAEKNLESLKTDLNQKSQVHEELACVLAQVESEKKAMGVLVQPVEEADNLLREMEILQKEVEELEYRLDTHRQSIRTPEEIQSELVTQQNRKEILNTEVENLRQEQRYMSNDLQSIQMRWHALREEKLKASNTLHKFKKAEDELVSLEEEKIQANFEEKSLAEDIVPMLKEKDRVHREHTHLKLKLEKEYDDQTERKRAYKLEVDQLLSLASKIKHYADSKKEEKLKEKQEKRFFWKSQLQKCESTKKEITADLNKSKELLSNQSQLKRNIDDNLNYRKTKANVDQLACDIEAMEEKILNIGGVSAVESELKMHLQQKERLRSERDRCQGTMSVYQSNIARYKAELKQSQYSDIDKRYFSQLIQLKTAEMANKDLDRYYNALDKALMRFHSMKMEEINKIIRELWQQTYRGQDIDYISIRSDSDATGTRSYSYRVVMQTGGAELEMRGRCSAGQKVLASLIIRLALAETFCLNCGILALDEPTTNLDGPNSESLAAALLRIMEDRKSQENFQLVVITHDERFAQMIGRRQHAEKYYRISKDDHQHSIIEAQEIFD